MDNEPDSAELEAQINLSLAFANDLVSDYLGEPSTSRGQPVSIEYDLKEYIHRPQRLGVGASVPKSSSIAQVQLKKSLVGNPKKRLHIEPLHVKKSLSDDDEEESRTVSIPKKPRLDPFEPKVKAPRTPPPIKGTIKVEPSSENPVKEEEEAPVPQQLASASPLKTPKGSPISDAVSLSPFSTPSHSPTQTEKIKIKAELQGQPLLNLEGPPLQSPSKKRRKRRRKKKQVIIKTEE